jgi:glutaredoxin
MANRIIIFHSPNCGHCVRLMGIMNRPDVKRVTSDVHVVASGQELALWKKHKITAVPSLISHNGALLEGNAVFDWLRSRLHQHGLDEFHASTHESPRSRRRFMVMATVCTLVLLAVRSQFL